MAAVSAETGAQRQERLETAIRSARTRVGTAERSRGLLIGGSVLLSLGVLAILLGWYGAARTPYGVEQTPYLISGGLLGLGLIVGGGALYVSYWLTQVVSAVQREGAAARQAIERLESSLAAAADAQSVPASRRAEGSPAQRLVATPTGTMLHRPDCPVMSGKRARAVRADDPRMTPCKVCQPL